jgi:hypothetical protein
MAVEKQNNAEIGLTTGTTVTTGNSSGGGQDAFNGINIGAGNTVTVSSVSPLAGTYSYRLEQLTPGTNPIEIYWDRATAGADFAFQMRVQHVTPATVNNALFRTLATTNHTGAAAFTVFQRTDARIHIFDTGTSTQSAASTGFLNNNVTYLMQLYYAAGSVTVSFYTIGSTTPTATVTMAVATTNIGSCRIATTAGVVTTYRIDSLKMGGGGFIARDDVSNVAPTATAGAAQYVLAGTTVTLSGSDADSDGSIASRAWTWSTADTSGVAGTTRKWLSGPTITNGTTQNATATMTTPGAYRAQYVVTDDGGLTSDPVFTNVFVYPAAATAVGVRDGVKGTWTRVGGDDTAVLNDANDATGWQTPDDPTVANTATVLMNPYGPGQITHVVRCDSEDGGISFQVEWYLADGTTLLGLDVETIPTTLGDTTFTLPSGGMTALGTTNAARAELIVVVKPAAA